MKLYIKQKVFSLHDRFYVRDEAGAEVYSVVGNIFTIGRKLHICDLNDNELLFIEQKVFTLLPCYYLKRGDVLAATVKREFTFFKRSYNIENLNWHVEGNFMDHDFVVYDAIGTAIATVSKAWLSWGDSYQIDFAPDQDELILIGVIICIDADMASEQASHSSSSHSGN